MAIFSTFLGALEEDDWQLNGSGPSFSLDSLMFYDDISGRVCLLGFKRCFALIVTPIDNKRNNKWQSCLFFLQLYESVEEEKGEQGWEKRNTQVDSGRLRSQDDKHLHVEAVGAIENVSLFTAVRCITQSDHISSYWILPFWWVVNRFFVKQQSCCRVVMLS